MSIALNCYFPNACIKSRQNLSMIREYINVLNPVTFQYNYWYKFHRQNGQLVLQVHLTWREHHLLIP